MQIAGTHFLCVIDDIFTKHECKELIEKANNIGWHKPGTGGSYMRAIMIDEDFAKKVFERVKKHIPDSYNGFKLEYINSHFRFSRYDTGGKFDLHNDGVNMDSKKAPDGNNYRSVMTLNIFLNDDFDGGETDFYENVNGDLYLRYSCEPKPGRGALFYHNQLHKGNKVGKPYKYLIRTDVMGY